MNSQTPRKWAFWFILAAFLSWDWLVTPTIDLRLEPPAIALGSGQTPTGGHCAIAN